MKYMIVPARQLQTGDVLFTTKPKDADVHFCGRVLGMNPRPRGSKTLEFRVVSMVSQEGDSTVLKFDDAQLVGVAREDAFVDVDVASLLADL